MAGEERQQKKKAVVPGATATSKKQKLHMPIIGSGSTWGEDELQAFNVSVKHDVDVRTMIPEKWFDFRRL